MQTYRQGDVLLRRVSRLPAGCTPGTRDTRGIVLALGEATGHAHVITDAGGDEPLVMVKVINSTPEPDGSSKTYHLRVPPTMTTATEAIAWTFGLEADQYAPVAET